ncbi:primosomal protein N' [Ramlibacter sp. PS4R-6]|uniref:primosomal protein N' n=1 Tax=Ramlibacter sp. PS4R-6 TaxID=3133438 RepID=UPI0030973E8F
MLHRIDVVVPTPAHSSAAGPLSYSSEQALAAGTLVRVPLGKREVLGIVWPRSAEADESFAAKPVAAVLDGISPLSPKWQQLVSFAADYYQRSIGEVALAALPPQLRDLDATQWQRRMKRGNAAQDAGGIVNGPPLTPDQRDVLAQLEGQDRPFLLYGVTGSGKTEVYLRAVQRLLEADAQAQALVLVPEINLTPQLQERFAQRFGESAIASLHSGMTPPQRLRNWLAAHSGAARVVLGTRMAVFASMPALRLVVVDEEHDASYKQQEGARYSARDLAVLRGKFEGAQVILGSATPSLESWQAANKGRYQRLAMATRVGEARLPDVRVVDMNAQPKGAVLSPPLVDAIQQRVARGEQVLLFLNRRGYAPVLACTACEWKSDCPNCSAYRVFHKIDRTLRCHHCGFADRVPRACPVCGNVDIAPIGRGTEQLEEHVGELLAGVKRADGEAVRIARMDADSTRLKGALEAQLARMHAGDVDVLVGTQMVTKGHDFRRISLVAAINVDSALFSSDFRAPERLFALLMQAAGRAGRDAQAGHASEMWVQTWHPQHALFAALRRHDYPAFAERQLAEREQAGMPPFGFQALVRADARTQEAAQAWLHAAAQRAQAMPELGQVALYSPVPATVQRIANVERAQMLVESASRPALQRFLAAWHGELHGLREKGLIRWAIDVDPLAI